MLHMYRLPAGSFLPFIAFVKSSLHCGQSVAIGHWHEVTPVLLSLVFPHNTQSVGFKLDLQKSALNVISLYISKHAHIDKTRES